jgi:hypothetical protein
MELVRKIVLAIEADEEAKNIAGFGPDSIGYHCYLVVDAGLAQGIDITTTSDSHPNWHITSLTSAGHDFADASRNETIWRKAITKIGSTVGGASIGLLKELLVRFTKESLGLGS